MANSPTLCQKYVAQAIQPLRDKYSQCYIIHYMYDLLLASPREEQTLAMFSQLEEELPKWGLRIAPEKVQKEVPFQYLGTIIENQSIRPQKVEI